MKISDLFFTEKPTFTNRYYHAKFLSPYDIYSESKYGYLDGAEMCLSNKTSIEDLKLILVNSRSSEDEYTKAFRQAIKDFIKQEQKESVTNE